MNYNLELDLEIEKAIKEIKKQKARRILIQLPEGLKPQATKLADEIRSKTNAKVLIWLGSCYGSCDVPQSLEKLDIDLIIQFGHSAWPFWPSKLEIQTNNKNKNNKKYLY